MTSRPGIEKEPRPFVVWSSLAAIMLAGLALRIVDLDLESAWWDEYSSLMHLRQPTLWKFLVENRTLDPATLPLYYTIEYLWSRMVGTDTLLLRIPSLVMGMTLIPCAFLLGRAMFGVRAGMLVAALVASSPVHIFHAQGIRMYVLFTLLATLSMYTYINLRQDGSRRSLWIHAVVQLLLSWTHPFAVLLPVVQGIGWLLSPASLRPGWFLWGVATTIAWLPSLVYLSTIRYFPQDVSNWLSVPDIRTLFHDLFQDDLPRTGYQVHISQRAWQWLPFGESWMHGFAPIADVLFTAIILFGFTFCVAGSWWWRGSEPDKSKATLRLLALWAVLPVVALLLASIVFRPMIAPRYTVHCSIALYLGMAALLAASPRRARLVAELLVIGLMLFQAGMMYPGPHRTDYLGAARLIREQANPETDVVIVTSSFEYKTFMYNADLGDLPVFYVEGTVPADLFATVVALNSPAGQRSAWIFHVIPYWPKLPDPHPSEVFPGLGIDFQVWDLSALQGIRVTKVTKGTTSIDPGERAKELERLRGLIDEPNPNQWLANLFPQMENGNEVKSDYVYADLCAASVLMGEPTVGMLCGDYSIANPMPKSRSQALARFVPVMVGNIEAGSEIAAKRAEEALQIDPTFGLPRFYFGFLAAQQEDVEEALKQFQAACDLDPHLESRFGGLVRTFRSNDYPRALAELELLGGDDDGIVSMFQGLLSVVFPQHQAEHAAESDDVPPAVHE